MSDYNNQNIKSQNKVSFLINKKWAKSKKNFSVNNFWSEINNNNLFNFKSENKLKVLEKAEMKNITELNNLNNYFIENNKVKEIIKPSIINRINKYRGKSLVSKFDIKNFFKQKIKKQIWIKNIKLKDLKPFLDYNIKIKSNRKLKNKKRTSSIKFNFNNINNKSKNVKKDDLKKKIQKNKILFKNCFKSLKKNNEIFLNHLNYNKVLLV